MEAYVQVRVLGKGSFGAAWLVQRRKDRQQFVAKEVKLAGMKPSEREMAKHEIEMLRSLNHPNITRYVDHFEHRGSLFIVMEYANGGDLYSKIKSRRGTRFTESEVMHFFLQICLAIYHMHERRILHRDLKSQNVFLTADGVVKLGDFGISTVLRNTYELKRTVCGTPYYFSPELCMNKPYNNKSDIWALGCILYELTTLTHAFDGQNMKALVQKILRGVYPPIHNSYSRDLSSLIQSMLSIDPAKRPHIQAIATAPYARAGLEKIQSAVAQANRDKKSCVDQGEKEKAKREAQARAELEKREREKKEREWRERQEVREREHQRRLEQMRAKMQQEVKDHEEKLRRIQDQQRVGDAKRRADSDARQKRMDEERRVRAHYQIEQQAVLRKREEEWERNMQAAQREKEEQERDRRLIADDRNDRMDKERAERRTPKGYDPAEAARAFREMRAQAAANRRRANEDQPPTPPPAVPSAAPPRRTDPPARDERIAQARQIEAPDDIERARRDAFWQMRKEAEENKRRLMGLVPSDVSDPHVEKQVNAPSRPKRDHVGSEDKRNPPEVPSVVKDKGSPPDAPGVARDKRSPTEAPAVARDKRSPTEAPAVAKDKRSPTEAPAVASDKRSPTEAPVVARESQPRKCPTPPDVPLCVDESDDDGERGLRQFRNNEAAADSDGEVSAEHRREEEYRGMNDNIQSVLNVQQDPNVARVFEDFSDPELEPGRFVLDGQTLHLPNVSTSDPLGHRVESLRLFLEHSLGGDRFLRVYRILSRVAADTDDEECMRQAKALLTEQQQKYLPVVVQLIVCEEAVNDQFNS